MQTNNFEYGIEDAQEINIYEKEYMKEFADEIKSEGLEELRDYLIRE